MMRRRKSWRAVLLGGALWLAGSGVAYASAGHEVPEGILWLGVILLAAKVGTLVERLHLPAVLGEILVGIGLGSLAFFGLPSVQGSSAAAIIEFLAQLGAVILLFQIGLESNIHSMRRVGARSFWVATVGVVAPFVLGTVLVGPLLLCEQFDLPRRELCYGIASVLAGCMIPYDYREYDDQSERIRKSLEQKGQVETLKGLVDFSPTDLSARLITEAYERVYHDRF